MTYYDDMYGTKTYINLCVLNRDRRTVFFKKQPFYPSLIYGVLVVVWNVGKLLRKFEA